MYSHCIWPLFATNFDSCCRQKVRIFVPQDNYNLYHCVHSLLIRSRLKPSPSPVFLSNCVSVTNPSPGKTDWHRDILSTSAHPDLSDIAFASHSLNPLITPPPSTSSLLSWLFLSSSHSNDFQAPGRQIYYLKNCWRDLLYFFFIFSYCWFSVYCDLHVSEMWPSHLQLPFYMFTHVLVILISFFVLANLILRLSETITKIKIFIFQNSFSPCQPNLLEFSNVEQT